jgi:hypothetical protein
MTKDKRERAGPRTRAEARRPKLDFCQQFPIYRNEQEMEQRE